MVLENRLFKLKEIDNIRSLPHTMHKDESNAKYLNMKTMSMVLEENLITANNHENEEKENFYKLLFSTVPPL